MVTDALSKDSGTFIQGIAYAVATLDRLHDQPSMCADVLQESGFKLKDFRGVDEYDRAVIRRLWRTEKSRWRR